MAAVLASRGHTVVGVDVDERAVQAVQDGRAPVYEPGLAELIREARERLTATDDLRGAVLETDVTFLLVPTPSDEAGAFSLRYVLPAAASIGAALRDKSRFHTVVLTSTVMPRSTGDQLVPELERHSGKRCGADFGVCYNPEFVALGSVIGDLLNPDFILIGESDQRTGDVLAGLYQQLLNNQAPIRRMNFVNAELTKLALNTFVTTKISYANMLAQLCERLPGADVDTVTSALGADSRVGGKYLRGALGYGGPCFPRDNLAFVNLAHNLGTQPLLAEATDQLNRQQVARLVEFVLSHRPDGRDVAVLGVAYKPHTEVVVESQGLELARALADRGIPVCVYDPAALGNARRVLGDRVRYARAASECLAEASLVVVATAWDEFRQLSAADLGSSGGRAAILDCWRILDRTRFEPEVEYLTLGTGPAGTREGG